MVCLPWARCLCFAAMSLAWLVHSAAVAVLASVAHIQFVVDGAHGDRRGQMSKGSSQCYDRLDVRAGDHTIGRPVRDIASEW